jgi:hypothetical protein
VALGARIVCVLATGHAWALEQLPASALLITLHAPSLLAQRAFLDGGGAERPPIRMWADSHDHPPTRKKCAEVIT